jgi:hypothetical protein
MALGGITPKQRLVMVAKLTLPLKAVKKKGGITLRVWHNRINLLGRQHKHNELIPK